MSAVAVIGGGAWGTALAVHAAALGHEVRLWVREPELVDRMRRRRDNPMYLPGVVIPEAVTADPDLRRAGQGATWVIAAVPSHVAREVYAGLELGVGVPVIVATKGLEEKTLALPTDVAGEVLGGGHPLLVLSGPSFAAEVARGVPTAVVVASSDGALACGAQELLSSATLRLYTNSDPVGVQVAGAIKNVIAIAAGVVDGVGMGYNTLAALITRGLTETRRLGLAMGGQPETFSGLAGLGDLVLTCTGELSRNRRVGQALGRGERLQDAVAHTPSIAEGVRTAASARALARRLGVDMPIVEEVCRLLGEQTSPREAVARLMQRPLTSEERTATATEPE